MFNFTINPNPADTNLSLSATQTTITPVSGWTFFNTRMSGGNLLVDARQNSQLQSLTLTRGANWATTQPNPATHNLTVNQIGGTATQYSLRLQYAGGSNGHSFPSNLGNLAISLPEHWILTQGTRVSDHIADIQVRYTEEISNVIISYTPTDNLDYAEEPNLWQVAGQGEFNTPQLQVIFLGETENEGEFSVQLVAPEWFRFPQTFQPTTSISHISNLSGRQGATERYAIVTFNINHDLDFSLPEVEPPLQIPIHPPLPEIIPPIQEVLPPIAILPPNFTLPPLDPPPTEPSEPIEPPLNTPPTEPSEPIEPPLDTLPTEPSEPTEPPTPTTPTPQSPSIQPTPFPSQHETDGETSQRERPTRQTNFSFLYIIHAEERISKSMVDRIEVSHGASRARFRQRRGNYEVFGRWLSLPDSEQEIVVRIYLIDGRVFTGTAKATQKEIQLVQD